MASSGSQDKAPKPKSDEIEDKVEKTVEGKKPKAEKLSDLEQRALELSNYYGVEYKDHTAMKFIEECVKEADRRAKSPDRQWDAVMEAKYSEKLGELRTMIVLENENDPQAKAIKDALNEAGVDNVSVSVAEGQYYLKTGGREASGNLDQPIDSIIADANKLKTVFE